MVFKFTDKEDPRKFFLAEKILEWDALGVIIVSHILYDHETREKHKPKHKYYLLNGAFTVKEYKTIENAFRYTRFENLL